MKVDCMKALVYTHTNEVIYREEPTPEPENESRLHESSRLYSH
jgi:hypothetical protein